VQGNFIGTNATGTQALGNGVGVYILGGASNNLIGGTAAGAGNVISGNAHHGVFLVDSGTSGNVVQGNRIGTDVNGTAALGNVDDGVRIESSANANTVGGTAAGAGNLISGNGGHGVVLNLPGTSGNVVQGNYIGTDATGTRAIGNSYAGVLVEGGASSNTIGGTVAGARNVISGNDRWGIVLILSGTTGNQVQGNFIGTNATGTQALGNGVGVYILGGASNNTIGGTAAGAGNVIAGNSDGGIFISGSGTTGTLVQGNLIGTDTSGAAALGNGGSGVLVANGASNNTIGGTADGAVNVIAGNGFCGILISGSGTTGNLVQGNYIGTDRAGTLVQGGNYIGVGIGDGATSNTIGGTATGARNVIAGNTMASPLPHRLTLIPPAAGVAIFGSGTTGNLVQGNYIGVALTGAGLGNDIGVAIVDGASSNTIGGTETEARNVISGNGGSGILISGSGTAGNLVLGNFIGTDASGTAPLGNGGNGITIEFGPSNNTIGGTAAGARNVISGNGANGVTISDAGTSGNVVQGNLIGTDATGITALANSGDGVAIIGAGNNTIGGTMAGAGNTIAFNGNDGVLVDTGTGNAILGNSISGHPGLGIELVNGGNHNQEFPVLVSVTSGNGSTTIQGTLTSTAKTEFRLEFFANILCNPSGYGEGEQFLGYCTVMTDGDGNASFTATFAFEVGLDQFIAATATDSGMNTSQFSLCVPVTSTGSPPPVTPGGQAGTVRRRSFAQAIASLLPDALIGLPSGGTAPWCTPEGATLAAGGNRASDYSKQGAAVWTSVLQLVAEPGVGPMGSTGFAAATGQMPGDRAVDLLFSRLDKDALLVGPWDSRFPASAQEGL
jgi:hypothetical protein